MIDYEVIIAGLLEENRYLKSCLDGCNCYELTKICFEFEGESFELYSDDKNTEYIVHLLKLKGIDSTVFKIGQSGFIGSKRKAIRELIRRRILNESDLKE